MTMRPAIVKSLVLTLLCGCGSSHSTTEAQTVAPDDEAQTPALTSPATTAQTGRQITFNGRTLQPSEAPIIQMIEARYGRVPDGNYWYDVATGAAGIWGGPVAALLPPGLQLGDKLPAEASGGGNGQTTGVFVNGRELHAYDVVRLRSLFGMVVPGRYWWDQYGNIGYEGGPAITNFNLLVRQNGGNNPYYSSDPSRGESAFVSQGCTAVSGRTSPSDSSSGYSYYVGCD